MPDFLTPTERSERMRRIRGRDTKPELLFRRKLHALGFRYRTHGSALPGKPDVVLARYRSAIMIHGCFWHCHANCRIAKIPKSNQSYWRPKLERNVTRDRRNARRLRRLGWRVFVVWECQVSSEAKATAKAAQIARRIRNGLAA